MNETQWREFLQKLSRLLLEIDLKENPVECRLFSPENHARGYVGFDGASETQIAAAETRLGARLPNSYRTFLKASNGWPSMGDAQPGRLWATEELFWIKDNDPSAIANWGQGSLRDLSPAQHLQYRSDEEKSDPCQYREAYIIGLLSISDHGDASDLLLSPEVVDEEGEWECWNIASWLPGAKRRNSFATWMLRNYDFIQVTDED